MRDRNSAMSVPNKRFTRGLELGAKAVYSPGALQEFISHVCLPILVIAAQRSLYRSILTNPGAFISVPHVLCRCQYFTPCLFHLDCSISYADLPKSRISTLFLLPTLSWSLRRVTHQMMNYVGVVQPAVQLPVRPSGRYERGVGENTAVMDVEGSMRINTFLPTSQAKAAVGGASGHPPPPPPGRPPASSGAPPPPPPLSERRHSSSHSNGHAKCVHSIYLVSYSAACRHSC